MKIKNASSPLHPFRPARPSGTGIAGAFRAFIKRGVLLLTALFLCATAAHAEWETPVNVILDTDFASDVDDAGVLVTLLAMEDLGEANILAVGVCMRNVYSILAVDAFTTYYGRPNIPIGTLKSGGLDHIGRYAETIAKEFPRTHDWNSSADAPEVIGVYREVLARQPDNSVTFVSVGPKTNVAKLLLSGPDEHSDLNGRDLVAQKVKRWVAMAGNNHEFNMTADAPASKTALDSPSKWPTPVLFSPHGVGTRVRTGEGLKDLPENNILRRAWDLHKGKKKNWNHPSYDQCAVHYAVRGFGGPAEGYYKFRGPGWYRIDDTADPDYRHGFVGFTGFDLDPNGLHTQKEQNKDTFDQEMIGAELIGLMMHNPNGKDPVDSEDSPAAPSDLSATVVSSSRIDLAWTDNAYDEDGFKIERSLSGGSFSQIGTVGANVASYNDTGLDASTSYEYRVRTYNAAGSSPYPNQAGATTHDDTPGTAPVPLIIDSDFGGDCDDAGALAVAHYLMNTGEAEIIGAMSSTRGHPIIAAIDVVNHYYGRPGIPIGHIGGARESGPIGLSRHSEWTGPLKDNFPHEKTNGSVPHSTRLYRDLLHHASGPVNIAVIGNQSAISAFLDSEADYEGDGIPLSGRELAEQKVGKLVLMAGHFGNSGDSGRTEWNIGQDPPALSAAQNIADNWPGEIIYTGLKIGGPIHSGGALTDPDNNPVALSYKESHRTFPRPGRGTIGDNNSWDLVAVFEAVRDNHHAGERFWELSDPGTVTVFDGSGSRKRSTVRHAPHQGGKHRYHIEDKVPDEIGALFDDMMTASPALEFADPTHFKISVTRGVPNGGRSVIAGSEVTVTAWLLDADGNHVLESGHAVDWSASGKGILSASQTSTDDFGRATVTVTVSSQAGVKHVVTATGAADHSITSDSPAITTTGEGRILVRNTSDVVDTNRTAEVKDGDLDDEGDALRNGSNQNIATGVFKSTDDQRSAVAVFPLPALPPGASVQAADFGVYFSGPSNPDTLFDIDLWAVRVDANGEVQREDYGIGSGPFEGQTLIARDFATPGRDKGEWLSLDAAGRAALGEFLQENYQAGDFVALRMTADLTPAELEALPGGSRYDFNSAPVLTLEAVVVKSNETIPFWN